jgi:glycosyltransferase involved in cell wall biosynthesis
MHLLLVADGRSPITRRWLEMVLRPGHTVSLISRFPCQPPPGLAHFAVIPVAFSQATTGGAASPAGKRPGALRSLVGRYRGLFLEGRYFLGPLSVDRAAGQFRRLLEDWQPDLVHALRIPFEGMLAAATPTAIPMVVSIWGNDLTFHARGSALMERQTLRCLGRADGLIADARRDLRLGRLWGLRPEAPVLAVPGSGGLDLQVLNRGSLLPDRDFLSGLLGRELSPETPILINPRGLRPGSVRNDVFFQALPGVLNRVPGLIVICAAMAGQAEALRLAAPLAQSGLERRVFLLPQLPQLDLWRLFHLAQVSVSPSAHDGVPNSLLEAMACGCFPVAGDIESIREWITPGVNGLVVPPDDPAMLAEALIAALTCPGLRERAARANARIVAERADVNVVCQQVEDFYRQL